MKLATLGTRLGAAKQERAALPPKKADPFYLSPEWRKLVARLLAIRGRRCQVHGPKCIDDGSGTVRLIGDHTIELKDGGAPLDEGNVVLMCTACHNAKTAKARAARMARRW